jgi:hypothetical protein
MTPMKKVLVLALVMVALIIPVTALSDDASGDEGLFVYNGDVNITKGFDDRTAGTVSVRISNTAADGMTADVYITDWIDYGRVYASVKNVSIDGVGLDADDGAFATKDVSMTFQIGTPGEYHLRVVVVEQGKAVSQENMLTGSIFDISVDKSIWSNTWTYVAIIIVIVIIAIAAFIRMRSTPRVSEGAGTFTAMEEERKAEKKRSGAKKEEYKGRKKKE